MPLEKKKRKKEPGGLFVFIVVVSSLHQNHFIIHIEPVNARPPFQFFQTAHRKVLSENPGILYCYCHLFEQQQ